MSETDKNLIWDSLSISQKQLYVKGKKEFEKRQEEKKQQPTQVSIPYQKPVNSSSKPLPAVSESQKPHQNVSIPARPIRYDNQAHKFRLVFFDNDDNPLAYFFRGDLEEIRRFIKRQFADHSEYAKVEIYKTLSDQLVNTYKPSKMPKE